MLARHTYKMYYVQKGTFKIMSRRPLCSIGTIEAGWRKQKTKRVKSSHDYSSMTVLFMLLLLLALVKFEKDYSETVDPQKKKKEQEW